MTLSVGKLSAFAADIKIAHTIFAMPFAVLAAFLAANGTPPGGKFLLIVLCMLCARTIAMSANRVLDASLDAQNPRTAGRAIPAGRLSTAFFLGAIGVCVILFEFACAAFWSLYRNPWPVLLSIPVLLMISAYPLLKRFTRLCHYYLGAALALAPLCAYVAVAGRVSISPLLLSAMVLLWTSGFDVLYGCQDYQADVRMGIHSVPSRMGIAKALGVARATHLASWLLLPAIWYFTPQLGYFFAAGVLIAGALLLYEHSLVKAEDLSRLNLAFFTANGIISSVLGLCGIVDVLLR